jgi:uncharacterized membrane protein YkgB
LQEVVLAPTKYTVVKNAASKDHLYLSVKSVGRFLVKDHLFFNAAMALSMVTLRIECLRLNNSFVF